MKTNKLVAIVQKEQEERAKKHRPSFKDNGAANFSNEEMHNVMAGRSFDLLSHAFSAYLASLYEHGKHDTFPAIPRFMANNPVSGNTTVMKEMIYVLAGITSVDHYLIVELAEAVQHTPVWPTLTDVVEYHNGKWETTNAELFWLFMLADYMKVLHPRFEELIKVQLFNNKDFEKLDLHEPIASYVTEDEMAVVKSVVKLQYDLIEEFLTKLI